MERLAYLLAALVKALRRYFRRKEHREAQHDRDQIDEDSAQYAADKFGDGRVRTLPRASTDADKAKRPDRDGG